MKQNVNQIKKVNKKTLWASDKTTHKKTELLHIFAKTFGYLQKKQ